MNNKIDVPSKLNEIAGLSDSAWIKDIHQLIFNVHANEKDKLLTSVDSLEIMRSLSDCMDLVVIEIYKRIISPNVNGIAVVAVGGYGRQEMSFYSDVDLMFLIGKLDNPTSNYISEILHVLWDFHLDIGYSSRTISEALKLAKGDIESCTAMMDGRFLVGDGDLFSDLYGKLYLNVPNSLPEKLNSWRLRRIENNASVQLLEPNVKESPGALRDIQSLHWAIKSKINSSSNLGDWADFLEEDDIGKIEICWRFFSSIRLHLHANFGRKWDVLDADAKVQVSIALGYEDSETELGVEFFMRDYYQNARSVFQIVNLTFERFTRKRRVSARTMYLEHGLMSIDNEIVIKDGREYFSQDPFRMLKIFSLIHLHIF